jgi:hypothetical protein
MIKTTIHTYNFDVSRPDEAATYAELRARLKATPGRGHQMVSWSPGRGDGHYWHVQQRLGAEAEIELETGHLFGNQWNTAPCAGSDKGLRVFDWAEDAHDSGTYNTPQGMAPRDVRRGHYLDITDEMRELRAETVACGYCGKQQPAEGAATFCDKCLDSPYLKEADLHLLRLRPVDQDRPHAQRAPLTEAERAELFPRFVDRQTTGANSRNAAKMTKQRADVIAKADKATKNAEEERKGMLWLLDRGFNLDNVLYYSHTGRFSFGWRGALSDDVTARLLDVLSEFPAEYELVTDPTGKHEGRKLSNFA